MANKFADCKVCDARSNSVFCSLEHGLLDELNNGKNTNHYKKGQTIFVEGNPPFGLYCINSGKVKITKTNHDGKETIIRFAGPGEMLGHRSLFTDLPYNATGTVIEDGKICFVSKTTIMSMIQKSPELSFNIIERLSRQMGVAENRISSLAQGNLRERLAEALLFLKESFGVKEQGRVRLDIKLTRDEIASMIGSATENVIRLMTEFKKDGYIEQDGKTIYLLDVPALEGCAGIEK